MAQVRIRKRGKTFSYIFEAGKVVEKGGGYNEFLHGNIGITSESISLKDFMTAWLDNVVALNVKVSSMQKYQAHLKNNIAPYLGDKKVQEITPAMLDEWVRKLLSEGLARNTLKAIHLLIHHALNYAVYPAQLISSNPAAYIKVPKNAPKNIVKRTIIAPEQFKALLEKYPFGTSPYIPLLHGDDFIKIYPGKWFTLTGAAIISRRSKRNQANATS